MESKTNITLKILKYTQMQVDKKYSKYVMKSIIMK